jgi:hypothetical protein
MSLLVTPFSVKQVVFVKFGPLYYPSVIIDIRAKDHDYEYLVHYTGWSAKKNEWVLRDRIREDEPDELEFLAPDPRRGPRVHKKHHVVPQRTGAASRDSVVRQPSQPASAKPARLFEYSFHPNLAGRLKESLAQIATGGYLVPLPRTPCVCEIVNTLLTECPDLPMQQFLSDLLIQFNGCLLGFLLCEPERIQGRYFEKRIIENLKQERVPHRSDLRLDPRSDWLQFSDVYGVEHFLRFLFKLPEFLAWGATLLTSEAQQKWTDRYDFICGFDLHVLCVFF